MTSAASPRRQRLSRRAALGVIGAALAQLRARPASGNQNAMILALDSFDAIVVRYRGRSVTVLPSDLIDALEPSSLYQMRK